MVAITQVDQNEKVNPHHPDNRNTKPSGTSSNEQIDAAERGQPHHVQNKDRDKLGTADQTGTMAGQTGQMIYIVKSDQSVEPRVVKVGPTHGSKVIIEQGIAAGDKVVTDGQLRLYPGAHVRPVPAGAVDSQTL